ncbi:MAG: hypothetical protein ACXQTI_01805 [Candidatus Nezhaarchaeales archaeon]
MPEIDVDRALEISEKISNVISSLLSMLLIVQMIGDLLGISVFEALRVALTRPWVIPVEWIEMYYPLWYAMEWALLILMLGDQVFTMRYMQVHKQPPPPSYVRWMSFAIFMISFWLALLFRYMTFVLITIFASISFSYTMFVRKY